MRKVWCHQIWIQNNLGFMVLILLFIRDFKVLKWGSTEIDDSKTYRYVWTSLFNVVCTICACIIQRCKANLLNFCRSYDRGDFPMVLSHTSRGCKIVWKVGNCLYSCSKMHSKFSSEPFISPFNSLMAICIFLGTWKEYLWAIQNG